MGTVEIDRIISGREVHEMVSYSLMQIWRLERDGRFPKRIRLGPGRIGWSLREIQDWIAARKAERDEERQKDEGQGR
jgi:prophage regulatory protein